MEYMYKDLGICNVALSRDHELYVHRNVHRKLMGLFGLLP